MKKSDPRRDRLSFLKKEREEEGRAIYQPVAFSFVEEETEHGLSDHPLVQRKLFSLFPCSFFASSYLFLSFFLGGRECCEVEHTFMGIPLGVAKGLWCRRRSGAKGEEMEEEPGPPSLDMSSSR